MPLAVRQVTVQLPTESAEESESRLFYFNFGAFSQKNAVHLIFIQTDIKN